MSDEHEIDILERIEQLSKLAGLIKILIGGAITIAGAGVAVVIWVVGINNVTLTHSQEIKEIHPKLRSLETWKATSEVRPSVAPNEVYALDKRLQRVEDSQAVMLDTLKRIDAKL
jgi:hypothetical protein